MGDNLGTDIINLFDRQRLESLVGLDDWADRLSYFYSVIVLTVCTTIVTGRTYFFKPISCYLPNSPNGVNFKNFFTELCLIQGTIPMGPNTTIPQNDHDWEKLYAKMGTNYYYWIPFILGVQMILFYLPNLVWRILNYNHFGINLISLLRKAKEARDTTSISERKAKSEEVAITIKMLLFDHRDNRESVFSDFQRLAGKMCGFMLFSKRLGTWTVASYIGIKLMYLANAVGQLYLMRDFLGFDDSMQNFGLELAKRISLRDDWRKSLYFPRTSLCRQSVRLLGSKNSRYTGTCSLPINLFNEKIYVFLWFWILYVAVCTALSIPMWFIRLGMKSNQLERLKKYFKLERVRFDLDLGEDNPYSLDPQNNEDLSRFIDEFLRYDGVFIIDMIYQHVGDIVAGEITRLLWLSWTAEFAGKHDFRKDTWNEVNDDFYGSEASSREKNSLMYPPTDHLSQSTPSNAGTEKSAIV